MDNFKKVSCYDDKGGFVGHSTAPKDELGDGYLKPANSTFTLAPDVVFPEIAWLDIETDEWHVLTVKIPEPVEIDPRESMIVTKIKAMQNLKKLGKLNLVLDLMDALPRDNDVRILWDFSETLHRTDPTLIKVCKEELGLDDEGIDNLFL